MSTATREPIEQGNFGVLEFDGKCFFHRNTHGRFDLNYYDGLARQEEEIKLTIGMPSLNYYAHWYYMGF